MPRKARTLSHWERHPHALKPLKMVFERYADINPHDLNYDARCDALSELYNSLIRLGLKTYQARKDRKGHLLHFDSASFADEIAIVKKFVSTLHYSQDFLNWIEKCRQKNLEHLNDEFPLYEIIKRWKKASSMDVRMYSLNRVAQYQMESYANDLFTMPKPVIQRIINPTQWERGISGYVECDYDLIKDGSMPTIKLAPSVLKLDSSLRDAIKTTHHETLHYFLICLVSAFESGRIQPGHRFYEEAVMQRERTRTSIAMDYVISDLYEADPEEIFCHEEEEKFIKELDF